MFGSCTARENERERESFQKVVMFSCAQLHGVNKGKYDKTLQNLVSFVLVSQLPLVIAHKFQLFFFILLFLLIPIIANNRKYGNLKPFLFFLCPLLHQTQFFFVKQNSFPHPFSPKRVSFYNTYISYGESFIFYSSKQYFLLSFSQKQVMVMITLTEIRFRDFHN